jgi:hypothetical protein
MSQKDADSTDSFDYYLPGTAAPSSTPGRVERFLSRLFGRRWRR